MEGCWTLESLVWLWDVLAIKVDDLGIQVGQLVHEHHLSSHLVDQGDQLLQDGDIRAGLGSSCDHWGGGSIHQSLQYQ